MDDITVLLRELGTEVGYGHIVDKQSRAGDLFFWVSSGTNRSSHKGSPVMIHKGRLDPSKYDLVKGSLLFHEQRYYVARNFRNTRHFP